MNDDCGFASSYCVAIRPLFPVLDSCNISSFERDARHSKNSSNIDNDIITYVPEIGIVLCGILKICTNIPPGLIYMSKSIATLMQRT